MSATQSLLVVAAVLLFVGTIGCTEEEKPFVVEYNAYYVPQHQACFDTKGITPVDQSAGKTFCEEHGMTLGFAECQHTNWTLKADCYRVTHLINDPFNS